MRSVFRWSVLLLLWGCRHVAPFPTPTRAPDKVVRMEVTGYCSCGTCCNWERGMLGLGRPVIASGPNKGKPKRVGITASGTRAQVGTVAADTRRYPFGTIVQVPGYGWGRVEDRGASIQGDRLDLYFDTHREALNWGRKRLDVQVWMPR